METNKFDLIILGGGISGSLMGISLMNKNSNLKVAIIEKNIEFPQKIGESTSDITTLFFRSLSIDDILKSNSRKAGLRFLFNETQSSNFKDVSEFSSPTLKSSISGYHLNRKEFDEALLKEAEKRGCTVFRPAEVVSSKINPFSYEFGIVYKQTKLMLSAERMLDSTGRARFLKNKLNWKDLKVNLNTSAISAHFKNLDISKTSSEKVESYWDKNAIGDISFSTTHFMRDHSWWWLIRIDENTHSLGFVFDRTKFSHQDPQEFYEKQLKGDSDLAFLTKHSAAENLQYWSDLAYCSEKLFEDGAAVIGDSGAFSDPFISPGLELICQQVMWLTDLYENDIKNQKFHKKAWLRYERIFLESYSTRNAIYKQWYGIMKYYDLMTCWLMLSSFIYFSFHVNASQIFKSRLKYPIRLSPLSRLGFKFFSRRINLIASKRKNNLNSNGIKQGQISYSNVRIVSGFQSFKLFFVLFLNWLKNYFSIEKRGS
jgi:flavin-dependent dehydrogenase